MPTSKKHYIREGSKFVKDGLTAFELKENIGSIKDVLVSDKELIGRLFEAAKKMKVKCSDEMQAMLEMPNTALIKVIQSGWSHNGNYYDSACLSKLPAVIEAQGPIQFLNHLTENDETKYDRGWEEIVSYTKAVWYDEVTEAVYAIVRFPREKQDTGWLFNLMQDEPSLVGISIDSAVYIQEDFEKDGVKGDKILGWAFFNSADYVVFASAGGVAIEASTIKEKIKSYKVQESKKMTKFTKEQITGYKNQLKAMKESIDSFLTTYYNNQAYNEIRAVIDSLNSFMFNIWWEAYDEETSAEERIQAIQVAFNQASEILQKLEFWKNPGAEYDKDGKLIPKSAATQESSKSPITLTLKGESNMKLAEFKTAHPEAFVELSQEAKTLAIAEVNASTQEQISALKSQVTKLDADLVVARQEKQTVVDELSAYKSKEAVQKKKEAVAAAIEAAGFTPEQKAIAITDTFVKTLEGMDDAGITAALEDRKTLVSQTGIATSKEGDQPAAPKGAKEAIAIDKTLIADAFADIQQ